MGRNALAVQIRMGRARNGFAPIFLGPRGGLSGKPRALLLPHPAGALQMRLCDFRLLKAERVFFFCAPRPAFAGSPVARLSGGQVVHIKHIPAGRPARFIAVHRAALHSLSGRGDAAAGVQSLGQQELTERFSGIRNAAGPVANGRASCRVAVLKSKTAFMFARFDFKFLGWTNSVAASRKTCIQTRSRQRRNAAATARPRRPAPD